MSRRQQAGVTTATAQALPRRAGRSQDVPAAHPRGTLLPTGGACRPGGLPRRPVSLDKNKPDTRTASRDSRQEGTRHVSQGPGTCECTRFTQVQTLLRLTFPESGPNRSHAETRQRKPLTGLPTAPNLPTVHPKGRVQA